MTSARASRIALAAAALLALPAPALADVKAGVDAWTAGDYETAVREWREPAAKGDPDALFNMAQAYRLGRGVEQNARQAEVYYAKAAAKGHLKAADNLGLLMFQAGRREEAMPYVAAAADRGDPRAQYLLGIAHFNGDLVEKDWVRAYALLTLAHSAGLPQAAPALQQMDEFIPLEQREQAQPLAARIKSEADARRASQFAAADLGQSAPATLGPTLPPPPAPTAATTAAAMPAPMRRLPQPMTQAPVGPSAAAVEAPVVPSVVAAQAAIAEASRATGTQSPAEAGATFAARAVPARPAPSPPPAAARPAPAQVAAAAPSAHAQPPAPPRKDPPIAADAPAKGGPWKVQLGAFSVRSNADGLWNRLSGRSELAGAEKLLVPAGRLTKLLAGGFASRDAAQQACSALQASGQDCLVTR